MGDFIFDQDDKRLYDIWALSYRFHRPWTIPPDTPPELVDVLQQAFTDTMKDPDFIAVAESTGLYLNPQEGDQIEEWVFQISNLSPEDKAAMQFLVSNCDGYPPVIETTRGVRPL